MSAFFGDTIAAASSIKSEPIPAISPVSEPGIHLVLSQLIHSVVHIYLFPEAVSISSADLSSTMASANGNWETISKAKREGLMASIPPKWIIPAEILPAPSQADVSTFPSKSGWFTKHELTILSTDAPGILTQLSTGAWTSEEVTLVFCKAAAAAHQLASSSLPLYSVLLPRRANTSTR